MKKAKRLFVILLATLVMVIGAVSVTYAGSGQHSAGHTNVSVNADGYLLRLTCGYGECYYNGDSANSVAVTLFTQNYYYDGERKAAEIQYDSMCNPDAVTVKSLTYKGKGSTSYDQTSTAPTDAGTYTATAVLVVSGREYYLTRDYTIYPKEVTVSWKESSTADIPPQDPTSFEYDYDGESHGPYPYFRDGDKTGLSISVEGNSKSAAGSYKAVASLSGTNKDNYVIATGTEEMPFTIKNAGLSLVWDYSDLVYNADVRCPKVKAYIGQTEVTDADLIVTVYDQNGNVLTPGTDKTEVGKYYCAKATLPNGSVYTIKDNAESLDYTVSPYPVDIDFDIESTIDYDGKLHRPEITVDKVFDGDKVLPILNIKGTRLKPDEGQSVAVNKTDVVESDGYVEEVGVSHASQGRYTATVSKDTGLAGTDAGNYCLSKDSYSCQFKIVPIKVGIEWYRPANDSMGNPIPGTEDVRVLSDGVEGDIPRLVFDGKKKAPTAKVKEGMLLENEEDKAKDVCDVKVAAPNDAITVGTYTVMKIQLTNPDYTADDQGTDYEIVPRPVVLKWDNYKGLVYDSKEHKPTVEVANIQETIDRDPFNCKAAFDVAERDAKTFPDDPSTEPDTYKEDLPTNVDRIAIDAANYTATAYELSNRNYTLKQLVGDVADGGVVEEVGTNEVGDEDVETISQNYFIDQLETSLVWSYKSTVYNASNQKPEAKIKDLQSDKFGRKDDCTVDVDVIVEGTEEHVLDEYCNVDNYLARGTLTGDQHENYRLSEATADYKDYGRYDITKAPLTATVDDKVGYYGDDPSTYKYTVKYTGLLQGDVNKDSVPGKYKANDGTMKDVVDESEMKCSSNYSQYGKPGTYKNSVSGLKSDNYEITYVDGKLTIKDKKTMLVAKASARPTGGKIVWNKVAGAKKYEVYFSHCNTLTKIYTPKKIKTLSSKKNKYAVKNLKRNNFYKFYIVALDENGKKIAASKQSHFTTGNVSDDGYTNPLRIIPSKKKVTVKAGKSYKLKTSVSKVVPGKKLVNGHHTKKVRYLSENTKVATVSKSGRIKGVSAGWCRIYVLGANGKWKAVEVTVK